MKRKTLNDINAKIQKSKQNLSFNLLIRNLPSQKYFQLDFKELEYSITICCNKLH